jgi:hypothetical protein
MNKVGTKLVTLNNMSLKGSAIIKELDILIPSFLRQPAFLSPVEII